MHRAHRIYLSLFVTLLGAATACSGPYLDIQQPSATVSSDSSATYTAVVLNRDNGNVICRRSATREPVTVQAWASNDATLDRKTDRLQGEWTVQSTMKPGDSCTTTHTTGPLKPGDRYLIIEAASGPSMTLSVCRKNDVWEAIPISP